MKYLLRSLIFSVLLSAGIINSQDISLFDIYGVWQGQLPCADCQYISYRLRLDKDMSYRDEMVYYDKDVKPLISEGKWELADTILTLSETGGGKMKFSVNGVKLTLLDADGNIVPNSNIYKLTRRLADDSGMLDRWFEKRSKGIDFTASGNEPFWSVDLDFEKGTIAYSNIEFSKPIEFKDIVSTMLADPNTVTYYGNTAIHSITVEITRSECTDNMSGDVSPYKVIVSFQSGKTGKTDIYKGCGRYLADKQLTETWSIETVKGKNIKDYNLTSGNVPVIQLNAAAEKFSGTAGCNNFFGSFEAANHKIIFGKAASTLMLCNDMTLEKDVYGVLNESTYTWIIENDMLIFSDLSGNNVMELRKVR